ncbi:hypothetical protein SYNPS1DRAFT_30597 [Syncephalis pseudoplumigaleata]|uniref:Uncharacterized protein n=1 Tax=Syncephalis pseudoplumigaleata TaxID=1712513 RepID=A0A4V1J132_9FUNG|nr:hypothetical protein SYNPS1DRAFT_30597 [Syncephalis pseudoplumigaleata]|eukprot:RKP23649.1 hypothetical protein SYNPS1DRAFT_30597 [Syncephalis pseudoplumigaleata]
MVAAISIEHKEDERVLLSLFEVLAAVLDAGFAQQLGEPAKRCCGLLPCDAADPLRAPVLRRLLDCLFHVSPRIRQITAELLYLCFTGLDIDAMDDEASDMHAAIEECLLTTQWDLSLMELQPVCLDLHGMLKMELTDRLRKRMKFAPSTTEPSGGCSVGEQQA